MVRKILSVVIPRFPDGTPVMSKNEKGVLKKRLISSRLKYKEIKIAAGSLKAYKISRKSKILKPDTGPQKPIK